MKALPDSGWVIDVKPGDLNAGDIQNIISVKDNKVLNLGIIKKADEKKVTITAEFFPEAEDDDYDQETED
jgi:hypothetical protein